MDKRFATERIIAVGASTGGTEAIARILPDIEPPTPPILIVQHIPPVFSRLFAKRLNANTKVEVKEVEDGDVLEPSTAYIARGGAHMKLVDRDGELVLSCTEEERVNWVRPSADVLFLTVAAYFGERALGIILTGMGVDGAKGLLAMRQKGAETIGQDAATSVVYGMPKAAFELGAVMRQLPLGEIAGAVNQYIQEETQTERNAD